MLRYARTALLHGSLIQFTHNSTHAGTVDFNLGHMPKPVNNADSCNLEQLPDSSRDVPHDDLFKRKRMKGWWPSYEVNDEGVRELNVSGRGVHVLCLRCRL